MSLGLPSDSVNFFMQASSAALKRVKWWVVVTRGALLPSCEISQMIKVQN